MEAKSRRIVLCGGVRTAFGHIAKSLSSVMPEALMGQAIKALLERTPLYPHAVDGVIVGWVGQGSHAPNIARIAVLKAGLPEKAHAVTVQANCVSGIEAICSAARHIVMGEGELYIAGGVESMSTFPYAIRGPRSLKSLRSLETLRANWDAVLHDPEVNLRDTIEEGLTDPVKHLNMAATAEVCAQMYSISRSEQDDYAIETFRRGLAGERDGFYASHTVPVVQEGKVFLEADEYPLLREALVKKPEMVRRAPTLFGAEASPMADFYKEYGSFILGKKYAEGATEGTVTLFNSCARSDGAAAVIVTSYERAQEMKLEILGEIKSWGFWGINPAHMGVSPVFATDLALERAGIKFSEINWIELHEAFAATCLSIFKVGREKSAQGWEAYWKEGKLNPHGGSIALGHPLAATGARVILNVLYDLKKDPRARFGLAAACAAGGLGGAMVIERVS
jgi:acetyl-CoA C-acetyltransferase